MGRKIINIVPENKLNPVQKKVHKKYIVDDVKGLQTKIRNNLFPPNTDLGAMQFSCKKYLLEF